MSCRSVTEPLETGLAVDRDQRAGEASARSSNANAARPRPRARSGWNRRRRTPSPSRCPLSGEINPENHLTVDFDYPLVKLDSADMLLTRVLEDNSIEDIPVRMVRDTGMLRR